ncbi:restriction endonuclease subunit S, partial [Thalassolituus sp. UBA1505]|uniref:restriction endonuclease subunit S n=1 Tax=Thalassolituus sp. UBA1505 TaxID=1947653 RepID=UPI0025FD10E6
MRAQSDRYFTYQGTPWVKTLDLNNGEIFNTDEQITEEALKETSCSIFPVGTVLVAMYGGFNQIGRTGLLKVPAAINQALSGLVLDSKKVSPEFLINYLNGNVKVWKKFAASSRKDPNITREDVCGFPVLIPPLPEQKKIAQILSTWDKAITTTEQLLA